jgi:hypothetical protein
VDKHTLTRETVENAIQSARAARERLQAIRAIIATRRANRQAAMTKIRQRLENIMLNQR